MSDTKIPISTEAPEYASLDLRFQHALGAFYLVWSALELCLCYGIGKFLKIPDEDALILTSGMEFGRKITVLRNLIYRSGHPQKSTILGLLGKIQNESKRNIFAHSFLTANDTVITFIERTRGGDYKVIRHEFTVKEFVDHVTEFGDVATALEKAIGVTMEEYQRFADAALSADTKATKSPVPPSSKA